MAKTKKQERKGKKTDVVPTWESVVAAAFPNPNEETSLTLLYARVDGHPRTKVNPHWKAKIRQVLQKSPLFESKSKGVWMYVPDAEAKQ
ncbi:MAG: hypothetical protein JWO36_2014 [Myxococcales bacterium]|nr:hypothetical protein [Myxococcales bacterium]